MRVRAALPLAGVIVSGAVAFAMLAKPVEEPDAPAPVVFVCRNGVAMSVWSAAYFNRLAESHGLHARAIARAAVPSFTEVPLRMMFALALDGFRLDGYRPHVVSADDVESADLVVAIDTELPADAQMSGGTAELWDGFPPMREQYFPSRTALKTKVEALVARMVETELADQARTRSAQ